MNLKQKDDLVKAIALVIEKTLLTIATDEHVISREDDSFCILDFGTSGFLEYDSAHKAAEKFVELTIHHDADNSNEKVLPDFAMSIKEFNEFLQELPDTEPKKSSTS